MTQTLLAIDGNNLLTRAVRAADRVELHADGMSTAPVLVFINMLSKYVRQEAPDRIVVCWDSGTSEYRQDIDPGYKASRIHHDGYERTYASVAKTFLTLAGMHHTEVPHVEADDLIAGYWQRHRYRMVILSGDKDFLQLLDDNTEQIRPPSDGPTDRWTPKRVEAEMGCTPEQLPLVMAIAGDDIDCVPGVRGFGYTKARKALERHNWDLDETLTWDPRLIDHRRRVETNLRLVNLRDGLNIPTDFPPLFRPTGPSDDLWPRLSHWCERYAMASIADRLTNGSLWKDTPRMGHRLSVPTGMLGNYQLMLGTWESYKGT